MLTSKGIELRDLLRKKQAKKEEEDQQRAVEEADRWAADRAVSLEEECRAATFNTTIEIVGLEKIKPNAQEDMRIAALELALGVTFDRARISRGSYAGEGGNNYAISMELGELLRFLEGCGEPLRPHTR